MYGVCASESLGTKNAHGNRKIDLMAGRYSLGNFLFGHSLCKVSAVPGYHLLRHAGCSLTSYRQTRALTDGAITSRID